MSLSTLPENTALALALLSPILVFSANRVFLRSRAPGWVVTILSILLVYALLLLGVHLVGARLNAEMMQFDLNGDDWFSGDELSPQLDAAMEAVASDTGRALAPFTGPIFACLYVFFLYCMLRLSRWFAAIRGRLRRRL
jgi:hypothetical protein